MPPKFPHGLKKDPTKMSRAELAMFGALAGSVGLGIYRLVTSPWSETHNLDEKAREPEGPEALQQQQPKGVEDGVTKVQFGTTGRDTKY
mmetsp:Transcript_174/g.288  ORF Transcript_174/g.288 Transcript_174/m.288 type:complete len:89 (+) Transcript_174:200-466(+)|eukprot:CAMPEP_0119019884 /NCGR_PEP_ID=MMETSP1176-20130426/22908_1 /TAXON_ID=265551 /ORGANISM="Synedropsis recta cf, Strain CCMP1620" /LENGTH=88 /DNA_ID=CAMNT_0006974205 /DNA_START=157 /DNA_END=423 /DNA_ORIENTATION=-